MKKPPSEDGEDYDVGYRKPPRHSRFAPGRSGNPKGRPKGTKNVKTDLAEELAEKIVVREGEKVSRVSKQRAMLKALVNRGLKGDAKAATVVLTRIDRALESDANSDQSPTTLAELVRRASIAQSAESE